MKKTIVLCAASILCLGLIACKKQEEMGPAQKIGQQIDQKMDVARQTMEQKMNQAQSKLNKAIDDVKQKIQNDPEAQDKVQKAMNDSSEN